MSNDTRPTHSTKEILLAALKIGDQLQRQAYLDGACGSNARQRNEVERLLAARLSDEPNPLDRAIERLGFADIEGGPKADPLALDVSSQPMIGPYKIREQLGEGGMGVVYVAQQTEPVRRKVALKIIKPGLATKDVVIRFEAERQALAMMDHPNIARVFDGGATGPESGCPGQPYFVMELVQGLRITEYCAAMRLSTRERLELFLGVCRAVQHAHQKGIIHRDLKPTNVLVPEIDGTAVPKVIDFGVAKAVDQKLTEATLYTRFSEMVGTPMYMSPEQASLGIVDIDTRSDIYSLGVLLYELLTGTTPLDREKIRQSSFDEVRRIIREQEPPPPSAKVSTFQGKQNSTVTEQRGRNARRLRDMLQGELDWIVMKALEKDRQRRYESASAMAADIERYLHGQPVHAHPPSQWYRLQKVVARNRTVLTAAMLVVAALLAGTGVSIWQALRAHDARHQAEENARQAQEANNWSQTLLYAADVKLASDAIATGDLPRAAELLERHVPQAGERDLRGFEWHYFHKRVAGPQHTSLNFEEAVNDVCYSPDGKWLAATAPSGTVRIYETQRWQVHRVLSTTSDAINGLHWSDDGRLLAAASADGHLRVWQIDRDAPPLAISAHVGECNDVLFSPDSRTLYSCGDDHLAAAWDVETGEKLAEFSGHEREVDAIALSPLGDKLATASSDSTFAVWNTTTGKRSFPIVCNSAARFVSVVFSSDGRFIAAGNIQGNIHISDCETKQTVCFTRQPDGVEALAFLTLGPWIAAADRGGAIQLHSVPKSLSATDLENARQTFSPRWIAHDSRASSLSATGEGRRIASSGRDGTVRVWTLDERATRWVTHPDLDVADIACGPNNRVYTAGREIYVWDAAQRRLVDSFAAVVPSWRLVDCSADGRYLAAARVGELVLFDVDSRRAVREWALDESLVPSRLAISSAGKSIALADNTRRESVRLYTWDGPATPRKFAAEQCNALAFSSDGDLLAVGHMDDIRLFDLRSPDRFQVLKGHSSTLSGLAFNPNGDLLATVSHDRLLKVWRLDRLQEIHSIVAQRDRARSVAFSPDGETIATTGWEGQINLWHTATGQPLGGLLPDSGHPLKKLSFLERGFRLIGQRGGAFLVYDATPRRPSQSDSEADLTLPATFTGLGSLPSADRGAVPEGMSSNGRFISGISRHASGFDAFRWSQSEGQRSFQRDVGNSQAAAVSDDGRILCGGGTWEGKYWCALMWTAEGEAQAIAESWSHAVDLTPQGRIIVGQYFDSSRGQSRAFRWEAGKAEILPSSAKHKHAKAVAVSANGATILGIVYNSTGSGRRGLEESAHVLDSQPVVWENGTLQFVPGFDSDANWWPEDLSADGTVIVGMRWPRGHHYRLPVDFASARAFRWTSGRVEMLPSLPGYQHGIANHVSGDGRRAVGHCIRQKENDQFIEVAVVWDKHRKPRTVIELLAREGVALGWNTIKATAVSDDGATIAGGGYNPDGHFEGWRAQLPIVAAEDSVPPRSAE